MKMHKTVLFLLPAVLFFAASVWAEDGHSAWETDFDAALTKAKESGKNMLVDFSGSDWCGWCTKLDEEVFSKDDFLKKAKKEFILVVLDFPKKKEVKNKERNEEVRAKLNVTGFPTVLLMDSDGHPYAKTGYMQGGAKSYLEHLDLLNSTSGEIKANLAKVNESEGDAKAKSLLGLFKFIDGLEKEGLSFSHNFAIGCPDLADVVGQGFDLDPENKKGLKLKSALFLLDAGQTGDKVSQALNELDPKNKEGHLEKLLASQLQSMNPGKPDQASQIVALVDDFYKDKKAKDKELEAWTYFMAGYAYMNGLDEKEKAADYLNMVVKLKPENSRMLNAAKKFLEELKAGA